MRKQVRRYFRKSLCGILSAAMIATSLIVPNMTVYAAPQDEAGLTLENGDDKLVDEATGGKVEGEDKDKDSGLENPGDGMDGDNENADGKDSENGGVSGDSSESGEGSDEESGDNADEGDKENPDDEQDDLTDNEEDGKDEELKSEDEEDDEKLSISPMGIETVTGAVKQGTFSGTLAEIKAAWEVEPDSFKIETFSDAHGQTLYIWQGKSNNGTKIKVRQTVSDVEPGVYQVSLDIGGVYSKDALTLTVEADDKSLTKSLGSCDGWGNWNEGMKSEALEVSSDVTITISGTIAIGIDEQVHIDNVELKKLSYSLTELNTLLTEADKRKEVDYTAASWSKFATAKSEAKKLVDSNSTDAIKITLAYANLQKAMNDLVSAGMTLYYYVGKSTTEDPIEEVGLCYWGENISTKAKEVSGWYGWDNNSNKTYQMTSTGYEGWYSIPLQFTNNGASAGFSIHVYDGKTSECVEQYDVDKTTKDIYEKLAKSTQSVCAVRGNVCYEGSDKAAAIIRQVTLYIYGMDAAGTVLTPYVQSDNAISKVDEATGTASSLASTTVLGQSGMYAMTKDGNWYSLTFSAPGNIEFDGKKICNFYKVEENASKSAWVADFENGESTSDWEVINFTPVFAGNNFYYKGAFYASREEAEATEKITKAMLQELIDQAKQRKQEDYKEGWEEFTKAITDAEKIVAKETATDAEIENAYNNLKEKMDALVPNVKSDVKVEQIALSEDFITGADLSSYISLKESGVVFKDENGNPLSDAGFFKYLYEGGTNWVRIRVWNDPYNSSGKGYGGGNNDLEKAKTIGKLATDAGMRVLIDFHYSDFWADPSKQDAPKAWKAYSVDEKVTAVHDYTLSSLQSLKAAGVDVGMVQVGNETNNGICGEKTTANMIKIFNAGSSAVKEFDENCLVAIHFTNPEKKGNYEGLAKKFETVNYDVFASSYYPFWHGTTGNLTDQLAAIAKTFKKKVMVAETSWVTTWDDGDGHENTAPRLTQDLNYDISLQGQADEIRDVVAAANAVDSVSGVTKGSAIGVFYWEPAWISPNYVYDEEGKRIDSLYKQNQTLWEQYGSGWASSYAGDYDPGDAGKWYGGSAIDNQAWFGFDGTALATAKIYSLIRTGAVADTAITSVESNLTREVVVGSDFTYPTVKATYNDGTLKNPHTENLEVTWDADEQEQVNLYKMGEYIVHGIVSDGKKDYKITLTIKVIRMGVNNVLINSGFEDSGKDLTKPQGWDIAPGTDSAVSTKESDWQANPRSDDYAMNFWFGEGKPTEFTVSQTVRPESGTYSFGGYIQGDGTDVEDVQYIFAEVYDGEDGLLKSRKQATFTLNGWRNWSEPEITGINVSAGDKIVVGAIIKSTKVGAWGSLDDFYLYGTHSVTAVESEGGTVATSVLKANSGEKVEITVTPDSGYYLETLTLSGASITAENLEDIFTSENGTVAFKAASGDAVNAAVLTYAAETADAKSESFTMPNGNVTVSATFVSVFGESTEQISLDGQDDGKYLVLVNGKDDGTPIEDQYYTGKDITPALELSYKGYKLTSADYTVKFADNKNITTADKKAKITLTATGDRFTGTRTIFFGIKEDNRKEFKNLKVTFKNPDKGDGSTPAKSTYYLGKQKELKPEIVLKDNEGNEIRNPEESEENAIYKVFYYNNKKIGKATVVVLPTDKGLETYKEGSVTTTFTIAKCPVNYGEDDQGRKVDVSISTMPQYYSGKKVEPTVTVKLTYIDSADGTKKTTTLTKGTDYTVTYSNNINATQYVGVDDEGNPDYKDIPNKVASVKITGKGNFTGTRTTYDLKPGNKAGTEKITFKIRPRSIENATITAADLAENKNGAAPKLTVKDGTKAIASTQYVITKIVKKGANGSQDTTVYTYDQTAKDKKKAATGSNKLKEAGAYAVTVAGKNNGNYSGEKTVGFEVKGKDYLISNAKITIKGKFYYTGNAIRLDSKDANNPELKVTFGSGKNLVTLTEQTSPSATADGYYVTYENNTNAGKATITITGTGQYIGKKTAVFTIGKRTLAASIAKESDKVTKGVLQATTLSAKNIGTKLDGVCTNGDTADETEKGDYTKLINEDTKEVCTLSIPYTGYTLNPEFKFNVKNYDLKGKPVAKEISSNDYTVTYSIGKWVEKKDETGKVVDKSAPVTATVKGKGNYSGNVKIQNLFTLTAQDLTKLNIEVSQISHDVGKALKPSVTFSKNDGRVVDLKLSTAYTVVYTNNKLATLFGLADNKKPKVTVKVKGSGWITNKNDKSTTQREIYFSIDQQEIVKTDVADIAIQTYKGKALTPAVTVKVNGKKLKAGTDYTVTYSNNVKRTSDTTIGTVTITGKGNYFTRKPIVKTFVIK